MKWGMKSIAITDHGVAQAFPEAYHLVGDDNPDIKVIYGVEAYLAPDNTKSIYNGKGQSIDTTYCVLDLETTGFSASNDRITEIKNEEDAISRAKYEEKHTSSRKEMADTRMSELIKKAMEVR